MKSMCCSNYICENCTKDYFLSKGLNDVDYIRDVILMDNINCPHCAKLGFHPEFVGNEEAVRDYSNPVKNNFPGSTVPFSPLRVGESFEDLKRKLLPFQQKDIDQNDDINITSSSNKHVGIAIVDIDEDNDIFQLEKELNEPLSPYFQRDEDEFNNLDNNNNNCVNKIINNNSNQNNNFNYQQDDESNTLEFSASLETVMLSNSNVKIENINNISINNNNNNDSICENNEYYVANETSNENMVLINYSNNNDENFEHGNNSFVDNIKKIENKVLNDFSLDVSKNLQEIYYDEEEKKENYFLNNHNDENSQIKHNISNNNNNNNNDNNKNSENNENVEKQYDLFDDSSLKIQNNNFENNLVRYFNDELNSVACNDDNNLN
jgi:hypothetical protein